VPAAIDARLDAQAEPSVVSGAFWGHYADLDCDVGAARCASMLKQVARDATLAARPRTGQSNPQPLGRNAAPLLTGWSVHAAIETDDCQPGLAQCRLSRCRGQH
jgi:hypothetical protein